ncbi:MAG: radical SAM protein [Patescibacteria group bacterium]|nr:radical SAM protein [Patescibacteria group bacterium]
MERIRPLSSVRIESVTCTEGGKGEKIVFRGDNNAIFETGSFFDQLDEDGRPIKHDICVSTMAGCNRICNHCFTPKSPIPFQRLLTPEEIYRQVHYAITKRGVQEIPNVVGLMGNGEPFGNTKNVIQALRLINEDPNLPVDRITISTIADNINGIGRFIEFIRDEGASLRFPVSLQYSLHAVNPDKRQYIIPLRKGQNIEKAISLMDEYARITKRPVKYNVVLMEDPTTGFSNVTEEDAVLLARLILADQEKRMLKISAFNPHTATNFIKPSDEKIEAFLQVLSDEGIKEIKKFQGTTPLACGKLREAVVK